MSGTQVQVGWGWQGYGACLDICEIEVDRADGKGFTMLTFDTTPNYTDTTPFHAAPVKWTSAQPSGVRKPRDRRQARRVTERGSEGINPPRRRPARRPVEQAGQRHGGG